MVTLQFIPFEEIESLPSLSRIKKLLTIAKDDRIALLQGRLKKEEEMELIRTTMEEVDSEFKGIELAVINPQDRELTPVQRVRAEFFNLLLGDRQGLTIIGPASVVRSIKQNPNKIVLYTKKAKKKLKKRGK